MTQEKECLLSRRKLFRKPSANGSRDHVQGVAFCQASAVEVPRSK